MAKKENQVAEKNVAGGSAPKKKSLIRRIIFWCALVVVFFIVAAAAASLFIPWNKVKDKATTELSKTLNRKVSIGKIFFNPFNGIAIEVSKISISNAKGFTNKPFVADDKLIVKFYVLPLFVGKAVIKKIQLVDPQILVERNRRGIFNFTDLTSGKSSSKSKAKASKVSSKSSAPTKIPVDIVISELSIKNGQITYNDDYLATPLRTQVNNFNLTVGPISLNSKKPMQISLATQIVLNKKVIPLTVEGAASVFYNEQKAKIENIVVKAPSVSISVSGSVSSFLTKPTLDVDASLDVVLKTLAADLIPPSLVDFPAALSLSGSLDFKASVKGNPEDLDKLKINGDLTFGKIGVKYSGFTAFDDLEGTIHLTEKAVSSKGITFLVGDSPLNLDLKVSNYVLSDLKSMKKLKAKVAMQLSGKQINLDKFFDAYLALPYDATKADSSSAASGASVAVPDLSKKIPPYLSVQSKINVDKVTLKDLELSKLAVKADLVKQNLDQSFFVNIFDGGVNETAKASFKTSNPTYTVAAKVKDFHLDKSSNGSLRILAAFLERRFKSSSLTSNVLKFFFGNDPANSPAKDMVAGIVNTQINVAGQGLQPKMAREKLKGNCHVDITKVKISHLKALENAADTLNIAALKKDLDLDVVRGDFDIKNQLVTTHNLVMGEGDSNMLKLKFDGHVDFDKNADGVMNTRLNPQLVSIPDSLSAFKDEKGWAEVDLSLKGPLTNPQVTVELEKAVKKAVNKKVDEVKQQVQQKVDEEKNKVQSQVQQQVQDKAKDLLKGLFH